MSRSARIRQILLGTADARARLIVYAVIAVAVIAAAILYVRTIGQPVFPVDDAYITLHNAQVLRSGHDDRFVGTPALMGATSAIHVVLVAIFLVFLKPLWAHFVVTWLGVAAYAIGLARLAFVLGASVVEAPLLVVAGVIAAQTPHQLLNGLETGWAMAAMVWALAAASERPFRRAWELPVLCGLMPFLRPELIALSGVLLALRAWDQWRAAGSLRAAAPAVARTAGWFAVAAAPWLVAYVASTGSPWPATVAAKQHFFAEGCLPPAVKEQWVRGSLRAFADTIGAFAFVAVLWPLSRVGRLVAVFAATLVYAYYRNFPGALGHYEQRYLYVLVPCLLFAPLPLLRWWRPVGRVACAALLGLCIWQSAKTAHERWTFHLATLGFTRAELAGVAKWVDEHVPPNARVLVHDAGYMGFASHVQLFDLVGLKTPSSLPLHDRLTWQRCGAGRWEAIARIAALDRPEYVIVIGGWNNIYGITGALAAAGWKLELQRPGVYEVYKLSGGPR